MPWLRKSGISSLQWVSLRPKAACAAMVNALATQVWDFLSAVGQFTTKGCLSCVSECPGYASLGFLVCSGSVYDQRLRVLR